MACSYSLFFRQTRGLAVVDTSVPVHTAYIDRLPGNYSTYVARIRLRESIEHARGPRVCVDAIF